MAVPVRNVIPFPLRIYAKGIRILHSVYFKRNCLREFFLRVIFLTIGNGDAMTFNIDENVRIVTATFIYVKVENLAELNQGYSITFLADSQCSNAIFQAIVFTDSPVIINDGIGNLSQ